MRIVNFFKLLARDYGHEIYGIPGLKSIPIELSYQEIAKLTSTSTEKVDKVLYDLTVKGVVNYSDNKLLVKF